ncbi:hypothetical protein [Aliiroseovarius sp. YM-037]|uniref:hypothetical protein n=1 Tax=Aliiroseovarius sp. YM-037 TaxID=3341728 RepID=UPI003A7FB95E
MLKSVSTDGSTLPSSTENTSDPGTESGPAFDVPSFPGATGGRGPTGCGKICVADILILGVLPFA